jgi:hypothetical protein
MIGPCRFAFQGHTKMPHPIAARRKVICMSHIVLNVQQLASTRPPKFVIFGGN